MNHEKFISALVDEALCNPPWLESKFDNSFILLSEFSELDGPRPVLTIPKSGKHSIEFDLNTFAVRIMSVDCILSGLHFSEESSLFTMSGDTQVVLTELSQGAVAYIHYFVLYDIYARGFVRPFCLVYVCNSLSHLMSIFKPILQCFTMVTNLLHFGNSLFFLSDLFLQVDCLKILKKSFEFDLWEILVGKEPLSTTQKNLISQEHLHDMSEQLTRLVKQFLDYCHSEQFSEHRKKFEQSYKNLISKAVENGKNDYNYQKYANEKQIYSIPEDIFSSFLGKKYDKPLRVFTDLCGETASIATNILYNCLHSVSQSENFIKFKGMKKYPDYFGLIQIPVLQQSNCKEEQQMHNFHLSLFDDLKFPLDGIRSSTDDLTAKKKTVKSNSLSCESFTLISYTTSDGFEIKMVSEPNNPLNIHQNINFATLSSVFTYDNSNEDKFESSNKSCLSLRKKYSFLPYILYSFCIGRTLVVMVEEQQKAAVNQFISGFKMFLPCPLKKYIDIVWYDNCFTINDLRCTSVIGLIKKKFFSLPNSLKPYVSIFDFEKETLYAPNYKGKLLIDMFDLNKKFLSETSYRCYIKQIWIEICFKINIMFSLKCDQNSGIRDPLSDMSENDIIASLMNFLVDRVYSSKTQCFPFIKLNTEKSVLFTNKLSKK